MEKYIRHTSVKIQNLTFASVVPPAEQRNWTDITLNPG